MKKWVRWPLLWMALLVIGSIFVGAISDMEDDDFEDGTVQGWIHPAASPNPPANITTGGPMGAGDNYLNLTSLGGAGAGSRMAVVNRSQWIGDYNAVGNAFHIEADMINLGATALNIRIGVERSAPVQTRFVSTNAVTLNSGGGWTSVSFMLTAAELSQVEGTQTLTQVLDAVDEMRLISSVAAQWRGDSLVGSLGVDNFRVTSVPVELSRFTVE